MNRETFNLIIDLINNNKNLSKDETFEVALKQIKPEVYDLKFDTFTSIYGNLKRRQMFKSNNPEFSWKKLKDNSINLCNKYRELEKLEENENKNLILEITNEIKISPVLMARLILDGFIRLGTLEIAEVESIKEKDKISISQLIKDTHLLKDGRLANDILECCFLDDDYGPTIDFVKNIIGVEYELKLEQILVKKGITFVRESEMREKGFDKTPDFKLELPIYLSNGALISWIDSKATFCDEEAHAEYYESQYKFYLNRFGSGLVIYWFGYLKDIEKLNFNTNKNSISVYEKFPEDYTLLDLEGLLN